MIDLRVFATFTIAIIATIASVVLASLRALNIGELGLLSNAQVLLPVIYGFILFSFVGTLDLTIWFLREAIDKVLVSLKVRQRYAEINADPELFFGIHKE